MQNLKIFFMRKLLRSLSVILLSASGAVMGQQPDQFAYAITDVTGQNANWAYLRTLNLKTGEYSDILLNGNDAMRPAFDASTKKQVSTLNNPTIANNYGNAAFATNVAAAAYDRRTNRLYYTPMFIDQLRYIDLSNFKVYFVNDQGFTGQTQKASDQGNIVTRMVIASDGYGYAMTNNGSQLIRFSTGKHVQVTDLGSVTDAQSNNGVSIHNSCSSYGGDMVADDNGNLYVFSARNHVFKLNIENRVATHLGSVSGLPANFTINGAVVNDKNQVVVSSAVENGGVYVVDISSWAATKLGSSSMHSSDLANSNLIITKQNNKVVEVISKPVPQDENKVISIYPNPVTDKQFTVQFSKLNAGNYTLQVTDINGKEIKKQTLAVSGEVQVQVINLPALTPGGMYMVKINDAGGRSVFSSKIVVQ